MWGPPNVVEPGLVGGVAVRVGVVEDGGTELPDVVEQDQRGDQRALVGEVKTAHPLTQVAAVADVPGCRVERRAGGDVAPVLGVEPVLVRT